VNNPTYQTIPGFGSSVTLPAPDKPWDLGSKSLRVAADKYGSQVCRPTSECGGCANSGACKQSDPVKPVHGSQVCRPTSVKPVPGTAPKRPLTYLASPYSHKNAEVRQVRFEQAARATGWLMQYAEYNAFSPIVHSHPLATLWGLPGGWEHWVKVDKPYLEVSQRLVVLTIQGWAESRGVQEEIRLARAVGMPVQYLNPGTDGGYAFSDSPPAGSKWDSRATLPETDVGVAVPENVATWHDELGGLAGVVENEKPVSTNPKDLIGVTKPPLRLVPPALMLHVSKVMALGAEKYGPYNWRKHSVRYSIYLEAAMRHLLSALDGEEIDPESNQPHTAHVAACMGIVLDAQSLGKLVDDRATPGAAAKLIKDMTLK